MAPLLAPSRKCARRYRQIRSTGTDKRESKTLRHYSVVGQSEDFLQRLASAAVDLHRSMAIEPGKGFDIEAQFLERFAQCVALSHRKAIGVTTALLRLVGGAAQQRRRKGAEALAHPVVAEGREMGRSPF